MGQPNLKYQGKVIGSVIGRKLMKDEKQASYSRPMDGFGMPKEIVDSLCEDGSYISRTWSAHKSRFETITYQITLVEIHYHDTFYQATVQAFREKGTLVKSLSGEAQYVLPRKYFIAVDSQQISLV